jgi:hypothetical protein
MSKNILGMTKSAMATRILALIAGTQKHPPTGSLTIDGQEYTVASLVQELQNLDDALSAADSANAAWKDALQNLAKVNVKASPFVSAYRNWILATYGSAPATLADYGMTPRKVRTPPTAKQTVQAVAKREATRAARHTMGSKQKGAIKGDVTGVTVTPVTDPKATPAPAPSPSSSPQGPSTSAH